MLICWQFVERVQADVQCLVYHHKSLSTGSSVVKANLSNRGSNSCLMPPSGLLVCAGCKSIKNRALPCCSTRDSIYGPAVRMTSGLCIASLIN